MTTWCVWMAVPRGGESKVGWSRVAGGLTQQEAEWYAKKSYFRSRAMPDAEPGHRYPTFAEVLS